MTTLQARLISALVSILMMLAIGFYGYHLGDKHATAAALVAEQGRTATALAKLAKEDKAVLDQERALRAIDRHNFDYFIQGEADAKIETARIISGLQRDVIRLRIPIRPRGDAAAPEGGPAAGAAGEEGHAELTADASEFLVILADRGDEGIRKHAAVVDAYERLRTACTTDPTPD
jgi:hypothetical protein